MPDVPHGVEPQWLRWAREIQALSQSGLAFTRDVYDRERYERLRELAADMMATYTGTPHPPIVDLFAAQTGYATPKVDVRGAVFNAAGELLLVREKADNDRWTLPGGWADVNDSPTDCVIREVQEEAGLTVNPTKLAAVWDRARHPHTPPYPFHIYKLFFICDVVSGAPAPGPETTEAAFFTQAQLPKADELSMGRVLDYQLARMFAHQATPSLPTEYD